jgi:hypothetical protein
MAAGLLFRSAVDAGLALGRAVAERVGAPGAAKTVHAVRYSAGMAAPDVRRTSFLQPWLMAGAGAAC